jgi:hypothetical protein
MTATRPSPIAASLALGATFFLTACSVKLQAPDEPIRFDVNVNITEQKRLEIDQELLALIRRNPALFGLQESDLPTSPNPIEGQ